MRLSGKKVVVVGGGSGIGLAVSKMAQREGASIVILGRSQGKLDQAKALIGEGTQTLSVDVMMRKLSLKLLLKWVILTISLFLRRMLQLLRWQKQQEKNLG
jgi:NAD(P)-dependent dehydrogenase (short-subunit alcohol dehydrogenase family)